MTAKPENSERTDTSSQTNTFRPIHIAVIIFVAVVTIALGIVLGTYINQALTQQQSAKESAANLEALNNNLPNWLFQIKAFPSSEQYLQTLHKSLVSNLTVDDLAGLNNDELVLCAGALSLAMSNPKLHPKFVSYFAEQGIFDPAFLNIGYDATLLKANYQTIANFLFQLKQPESSDPTLSKAEIKFEIEYKDIPSQPPGYDTDPSPLPEPKPKPKLKAKPKSQPKSVYLTGKPNVKIAKFSDITVCIDPGHGTVNGKGKVTNIGTSCKYNGRTVPEYVMTLEYSIALKNELQRLGFKVVMTRDRNKQFFHDTDKYDSEGDNIKRAQISNKANADFFLRMHFDGGASEKRGFACWYNAQSDFDQNDVLLDASKKLGYLTLAEFKRTPYSARGVQTWSNRTLWGLKRCNSIAIVYECAFMSNPEDVRLIFSDSYKAACVKSIADAVVKMVKNHPEIIINTRKLR